MLYRAAARTRSAARSVWRRGALVLSVVPVLFVLGAAPASASIRVSAQETETTGGSALAVFGPVGLIAVAVGLGGLALGLLRQRRTALARQRVRAQEAAAHTQEIPAIPRQAEPASKPQDRTPA
ncbi:hypothetical protein EV191_109153 [Tamaricihabitans halophyticus]|uniref:Uncharacterized protein n=1 Tax=Tamaricihabitans halophyticus TaxID=1262583 RepID=A0A4R2QQL4_9PSEU|nr:hypothetical protein [Tamaricihabitans halophyticus]TCP49331.1 hypothetical protein EV191_109153 [Tamaricihabitans halophyticus]